MTKSINYLIFLVFFGLFFASCTKDEDGLVAPDIPEGIHFNFEGHSFSQTSLTKSYEAGNMYFQGREKTTKTEISFIVQDKMKVGKYNFANIYNVTMNFLPFEQKEFVAKEGKFTLYELDKDQGTLKATFDCVFKNKNTGEIIYITDGRINIEY